MPQYHIELRTENRVWETLDVESIGLPELRIEMAKFVGELLRDHASRIWEDQNWRVDVTDQTGLILFVMQVVATESAATMPLKR
jgi:hypothetical protein